MATFLSPGNLVFPITDMDNNDFACCSISGMQNALGTKLQYFYFFFYTYNKVKAVTWKCSVKKLFSEVSQNSQEETLAQVFSYEFCKISKNAFCYRTPLVTASVKLYYHSSTLTSHILLKIFSRSICSHLLKTSFTLL